MMRVALLYAGTLTASMLVATTTQAYVPQQTGNYVDLIGAGNVAAVRVGNGVLGVTPLESDTLVQTNGNDWSAWGGQLGVGYVHYFPGALPYSENLQWFPSIEPEFNVYYLGKGDLTGEVWRYNSPAFNQMTYTLSLQSIRAMADGVLTLASKNRVSVYAIGGIGNAWNRLTYKDMDSSISATCPDQGLSLNARTSSKFAWEAGAGVTYAFNNRAQLSLQYLYADLGSAATSATGNTGAITNARIIPATFNLDSQSILLGLHVAI